MCYGCYIEYEEEPPSDEARKVGEFLKQVPEDLEFGNLHVVVADWNIEDEHLDWCKNNYELTENELKTYELLKPLSLNQRAAALAVAYEGV